MSNPYINRLVRIGAQGRKSEARIAQKHGARLTPASGAAGAKGDMTLGDFLIEAKSTINDSMSVKFAWLAKIETEALATAKTPALFVTFLKPSGAELSGGSWVLVPERVFREHLSGDAGT